MPKIASRIDPTFDGTVLDANRVEETPQQQFVSAGERQELAKAQEALSKYLPEDGGTLTQGQAYRIGEPTGLAESAIHDVVEVPVSPGDRFLLSAIVLGSNFALAAFAGDDGGYLAHVGEGTTDFETYADTPVTVPADPPGITRMFVTGRNDRIPDVPVTIKRWKLDGANNALKDLAGKLDGAIDVGLSPSPYALPLLYDANGNVALWLINGLLDGSGLGPEMRAVVAGDIGLALDGVLDRTVALSRYAVPLVVDSEGSVPLWLVNGMLDGSGLGPELLAYIQTALDIDPKAFALRDCPTTSTAPVVTDGRTLWKAQGKLATLAKSGTALLNIGLTGNSWSEQLPIAMGMRTYLERLGYAWAGPGWIYVRPGDLGEDDDNQWPEVDLSFSAGWSLWDVVDAGAPDTYGCGPDGHALWAVGTTATLDLTTVGTDFRIFYRKTLGTFVWSTDGGLTWSDPVTGDGSGDLGIVHIAGLAPGQHTLKIALTGNTDTVVLYGFHAIDTTVSGFVINKMGNGGAAGNDYLLWANQYIQSCAAEIGADVIFDNSITNDFRLPESNGVANTPATCAAAADAVAANWQAACPGAAVVSVCPSLTNAAAGSTYEVPAYRDALYAACIAQGREFANLCDTWGSWAEESANGQYADGALGNLHPGDIGGYRIARFLISTFLKPERLSP